MSLKNYLFACLLAIFTLAAAQNEKAPEIPGTPAGKQIMGYIKAFNSGDPKALGEFMDQNDIRPERETPSPEKTAELFKILGKLKVSSIPMSKEHEITVLLKTEKGMEIVFACIVQSDPPHKMTYFRFEPEK
ncbi:MAG TPA: hypothetical protein VGB07_30045 [Blastocatellia bacterium]